MTGFDKFMLFLQGEMTTPTLFSWFHIMCLCILIASCVTVFLLRKRISQKAVNNIVLIIGIMCIVFEIYKQLVFSYNYEEGVGATWDFQWYAFPYQFCSTPMYLMVLAGILRKGKVYNAIMAYLATFSMFAGLCVMLYPGNVFISMIGINIQTMFCHGTMFFVAFLLLATRVVPVKFETVFKGLIVFVIVLTIALLLNVIWHYCGNEEDFNMFYISPFVPCDELPILNIINEKAPYIVYLLCYILGFTLAAFLLMCFAKLFRVWEDYAGKSKMYTDELEASKIIKIIKSDL
ncbi:MAG: hypothetical protein E7375_02835 [Clostridiales bacterium]|nr:hypothetical protein [Clostridiales bacterium]